MIVEDFDERIEGVDEPSCFDGVEDIGVDFEAFEARPADGAVEIEALVCTLRRNDGFVEKSRHFGWRRIDR